MNSVYNLLNEDIIPGVGIGELQIGRTRKSLEELFFTDFNKLESDPFFSSSISIRFSDSGYLSVIELKKDFKGSLFGYIDFSSTYQDLKENFCHLREQDVDEEYYVPGFFEIRIFNEKYPESGVCLNFGKNIWKNQNETSLKSILIYQRYDDFYYVDDYLCYNESS